MQIVTHNEKLNVNAPSFCIRNGHPDFLGLPWSQPLAQWDLQSCPRLEQVPCGASRHPVRFVNCDGIVYALKELPVDLASTEFKILRSMEESRLPVITPVGHVSVCHNGNPASVLITKYLERSLPYSSLFTQRSLEGYRNHLLDAMAGLLVELHLGGFFWGDCSLANTLFRRDAGALRAYLVDAETSECHSTLSRGMKDYDLDIMQENVAGGLADLVAMGALPQNYPIWDTGPYIREQYRRLWNEITREEVLKPSERYRIQERVRTLNELGFSVDYLELLPSESGDQLRLKVMVTDRNFHRHLLHSFTGLDVEEMQARLMVNEIQEVKASLSRDRNRSAPLSVAAYHWASDVYEPIVDRLGKASPRSCDSAELYCQVLEHKWYLSERAKQDVGHLVAVEDFLAQFGEGALGTCGLEMKGHQEEEQQQLLFPLDP